MALSCGQTCLKYLLFVTNFMFFVFGCACVAVGIWALIDNDKMLVLTEVGDVGDYDVVSLVTTAAYVFIASGAFAIIIGFFGCCGAVRENNCMLVSYCGLVVLVLIMQIAVVVISIVFQTKVTNELKDFLRGRINEEYDGNIRTDNRFSRALDLAQVQFMCCGVDNYLDFDNATKWQNAKDSGNVIPFTCCKLEDRDDFYKDVTKAEAKNASCQSQPTKDNSYLNRGCWDSILDFVEDKAPYFIGVGVGIAIFEIMCVVFAICLVSALKKEPEEP